MVDALLGPAVDLAFGEDADVAQRFVEGDCFLARWSRRGDALVVVACYYERNGSIVLSDHSRQCIALGKVVFPGFLVLVAADDVCHVPRDADTHHSDRTDRSFGRPSDEPAWR
ncbi:MAG: hypothetical protein ACI8Y4_002249 [Candidatus Poriferisodalaceae bacterium]